MSWHLIKINLSISIVYFTIQYNVRSFNKLSLVRHKARSIENPMRIKLTSRDLLTIILLLVWMRLIVIKLASGMKWTKEFRHRNYNIIIIMSRCPHGSPWPSLAIRLYCPSLLGGLQGYILYQHRAVVYKF